MNKIIRLIAGAAAAFAITLAGAPDATADSGKIVVLETRQTHDLNPWAGYAADSMRFQCLWLQRDIGYAGHVDKIEFDCFSAMYATFYNCRILLCHTGAASLVPAFATNYGGNTPVEVFNGANSIGGIDWIDTFIKPQVFNYNNRDNLLMEVVWNGDSGRDIVCYLGGAAGRRCYSHDYQSSTGRVHNDAQRVRLTVGVYPGLEPTSLGRVKTLFR